MSEDQEEDEPHRGSSFRLSGSPLKSLLLVTWLTVCLLSGGVSPVQSGGANQRSGGDDGEVQRESNPGTINTWTRAYSLNNKLELIEDINLIEELPPLGSNNGNEDDPGNKEHYTHQWAVHILGGPEVARKVAEKHGFQFHGEIFQDYYHLIHARVAKRSIEPHAEYHERLASEPEVRWLKQQTVKSRKKRDFLPEPMALSSTGGNGGGGKFGRRRAARRSKSIVLNDPRWPAMWYLNRGGGLDMNVLEAWNEGITGKGIVVTILDDGLEKDHPDIVRNYDPMASFDVNSLDMDPMPTYDLTDSNRHGTRCAGEVAAEANNSICAVGIAFEAGVGGVRMLDGDVTDAVEARSLSHNPQHIDIYSASWGPDDDGKTVDGPGELATRAFMEGVTKGRNGKGSIFVWASGNGGRDHDNCNCDGYTNSIWTLSISSATENGFVPWYSEACSSTLATTYSSGGTGEKQIVTIDLHHSCTSSHTGTSASAPLAAGICALALQANTNLTWRDMQHIVVRTARPQHLIAGDWATNGVGRNVSHSFGYGLMDAGSMVKLAKKWKTVPQQHKCEIKAPYTDKNIPSKSKVTLDLKVTNCPNVNYLEHVQAKVTLTSGRRGDLQIFLVSPAGTRSQLLAHRRHDLNRAGFTDWPFMTVHSWGESPIGKWTLEIHNEGRYTGRTVLKRWSLVLYGTEVNVNTNYSGGGNSNSTAPLSPSPQHHGVFSSFMLYTPRNSSSNKSSFGEHTEGGGKGDVGGASGKSKGQRQRQKGKLISKKQKGATSSTPTVKPPPAPSESHVIITSDDEEFQQFLQSKFGLMRLTSSLVVGRSEGRNAKGNNSRVEDVNSEHTLVPILPLPKGASSSSSTLIRASSQEGGQEQNSPTLELTTTAQGPLILGNVNSSSSISNNNAGGNSTFTSMTRTATNDSNVFLPPISSESLTSSRNLNSISSRSNTTSSSSASSQEPSASSSTSVVANNQSQIEQGKLQTWSLIAHGISTNPNDLVDGSGTGGGDGSFVGGGADLQRHGEQGPAKPGHSTAPAVVEQFDGSDNTIAAESSSSLQNSGAPVPAHAGVAKPVSIVGRPSAPAESTSSSATCAKMSAQGQCLECVPGLALLHSGCVSRCPNTFYVESRGHPSLAPESEDASAVIHYVCMPCHYSCETCSGPQDDECVTCHEDARLHRVMVESDPATTTDKAHCYPLDLMNTLDKSDLSHRILLAIVAVSTVFILCMLALFCCDCFRNRNGGTLKDIYEHSGQDHNWLRKGGPARPYKRISPEELDDDDEEYDYYDAYRHPKKGQMSRKFHSNQTHLELISEDEEEGEGEDDFEQLVPPDRGINRDGALSPGRATAGVHGYAGVSPQMPSSSSSTNLGSSIGGPSVEEPLV